MSMRVGSTGLAITLAGLMAAVACGGSDENSPEATGGTLSSLGGNTPAGGNQSGGASKGGAAQGGAAQGGAAQGGTVNGGSGGNTVAVGGVTNGGTSTGGTPSNGGASLGGTSGAGAATGGATSIAGATNGGAATGGIVNTGGTISTAGNAGTPSTGGVATGGATVSVAGNAGQATGGAGTGGAATGGNATAGATTGGAATGGTATGGTSTGGAATGGLAGVAGYVSSLPPSCAADPRCGPEAGEEGSCCKSIEVPGGTFKRGRGTETCPDCQAGCPAAVRTGSGCGSNETPEMSITVSSFKLDKYLVTVARMKTFLENYNTWRATNPVAGAGAHPADSNTGYRAGWSTTNGGLNLTSSGYANSLGCISSTGASTGTSTYTASGNDNYPVNCINWVQAFAFCIWDGGRLPSEAEWEYAAAGGSENRLYPWGSAAPDSDSELAVYGVTDALHNVGTKQRGAARWGHLDMSGLVWEWVWDIGEPDLYDSTCTTDCIYYPASYLSAPGIGKRLIRGGSFSNTIAQGNMRAAKRFSASGTISPPPAYGFRCAR